MFRVKRKAYRAEALEKAIISVRTKKLSVSKAATEYGVPRQTLSDKVVKKHPKKYGGNTKLSSEDETVLAKYITYMASIGHPLNVGEVKLFAWSIAKRSATPNCFGKNGPSNKWWLGYKRRHEEITLRRPDKLDRKRNAMARTSVIDSHFNLLLETLEKHDILNKPSHIFNVDESGMEMDSVTGKVVVNRNSKHTYQETSGEREHITVNVCASADGHFLPPMIIFERCFPSGHYSLNGPPDTTYAWSESGWMDGDLFKKWFETVFLPNTEHLRALLPALLILDGHTSHLTLDVIDLARENNVILFCLPPHTTHLLQPLDVAVFKSLKAYFTNLVRSVRLVTMGTPKVLHVNRTNFTTFFREAFQQAMTVTAITNGFRKCGIFPFSPAAIDWSKVRTNVVIPSSIPSSSSTNTSLPESIRDCPLLANDIIPERLKQCLIVPHFQETKKQNTRVVTSSRVITSDEHRKLVAEKLEAKRKMAEEKEKRRQLREEKKLLASKQKKLKAKEPSRLSERLSKQPQKDYSKIINLQSDDEEENDEDGECCECGNYNPPTDDDYFEWKLCEECKLWHHSECQHHCPLST